MDTITPATLYWISRCNSICALLIIFIILSGVAFFVTTIICAVASADDIKVSPSVGRIQIASVIVLVFALFARAATPTTQEMAAILVVPRIANSQTVQELGSDVVDLAKQWITELKPTKNKEQDAL